MQSLPLSIYAENEDAEMKFKLLIASSVILLSLCVFLIFFYTHMNAKTVSGNEDTRSCGYVPYLDSYLYIDMNGKVLSVTASANDSLPVIEGLKFKQFVVGDYLKTDNNDAFNTVTRLVKLIKKYELGDRFINKIDVAKLDDIHLYTNNVYVAFGSINEADEKIRILKEIIANLHVAEDVKGQLDISVIGRQYIFTVLT